MRGHRELNSQFSPERQQRIEAKKRLSTLTSFKDLFPAVEQLSLDIYTSNPKRLGLGINKLIASGIPEDKAHTIISDVLERREYHESEITPAIHCDLLEISSQKERISRALIREVVEGDNNLDLSPFERELILGGLEVQNANDALYLKVRRAILGNDSNSEGQLRTNPHLQTDGKPDPAKVQRFIVDSQPESQRSQTEQLFTDPYNFTDVIFLERKNEGLQATPWPIAFPQETQNLTNKLEKLKLRLRALSPKEDLRRESEDRQQPEAYDTYITNLIKAISSTSTDIQERSRNWREVDTSWMDTKGRVQFIHMMESYHDKSLGRRQDPEFNILIQDKTEENRLKEEQMTELKLRQLDALRSHFPQNDLDFDPIDPLGVLKNARAELFDAILPSGASLAFRFAGDNVPNNPFVKAAKGVKIIENKPTFIERAKKQIDLLKRIFGDRINLDYFPIDNLERFNEKITDILETVFVPGHEFAHNILSTDTHMSLLTHYFEDQLEEYKADLGIITVIPDLFEEDFAKQFVATLFADALRALTHHDSHRNGAVMSTYNLFESEILTIDESNNVVFDPDGLNSKGKSKISSFFDLEMQQLERIKEAYLYDKLHPEETLGTQQETAQKLAIDIVNSFVQAAVDPRMQNLIGKLIPQQN